MMEGRPIYKEEHELFRQSVRRFFADNVMPYIAEWEEEGITPREVWRKAGAAGLLCPTVSPDYGGAGGDFLHLCVIDEELGYTGQASFTIQTHTDIVAAYVEALGTAAQKRRWLPKMVSGEMIGAVAMTEPHAGSDLKAIRTTARRDGDEYVISGSKTFITNGINADLIIVVAKTAPELGSKGVSLIVVEGDTPGFRRGKRLKKMGMKASDTAELFFDEVRVPVENLLGQENLGFRQVMHEIPKERLSIATVAMGASQKAFDITVAYVKERKVFGKSLMEFQNTQFKLAECKTEATIARVFVDDCAVKLLDGKLDATTAAMAKWWTTQKENEIIDTCLQFFGGYGYMMEYPIAKLYTNARIQKIYGGTNEIMKMLVARTL